MPITNQISTCCEIDKNKQENTPLCVFETKEEFIAHLIKNKEILKDPHRHSDGLIHLKGTLKIDERVKKGLNWNDVVVTTAIVNKGMVSRYQYLPRTHKGVKTSLKVPSLALYMFHNNFNAICIKDKYMVDMFRIPAHASHLNFSSVSANLTLFYGQKIGLSCLPKAKHTLGLRPEHLEIDCKNPYKVAKSKGCSEEVLKFLRPENAIIACIYGLIGHKK